MGFGDPYRVEGIPIGSVGVPIGFVGVPMGFGIPMELGSPYRVWESL